MYEAIEIKFWEISKRFFSISLPIVLLLGIYANVVFWSMGFRPELGGLALRIIEVIVKMTLGYFLVILPLYIFKPVKWHTRLATLIIAMLLTIVAFILILEFFIHPTDPVEFFGSSTSVQSFLLFLTGITYIIWLYWIEERQYVWEKRVQEEKGKRISNEKMVIESHLKLLQAQIEPHFLFNTLTSIVSLDDTDPQSAETMEMNFIQYLKATLVKTRASVTTIEHEIEVIRAYLDIFKIRMGNRLNYKIDISDEIRAIPFPSMLIQPIVENAIKHGIEPKIEGGEITIKAAKEGGLLHWEISDTGMGISEEAGLGIGLSNIIERIESLYGNEGKIIMEENKPSGLRVTIEVPYV